MRNFPPANENKRSCPSSSPPLAVRVSANHQPAHRRLSNPRVQKFDGGALEVTLIASRQNEIVLQSNCTNRRIREVYWVGRRIRSRNHLCVGRGRAFANWENAIEKQRYQLIVYNPL